MMATAEIDPLQSRQKSTELCFKDLGRPLQRLEELLAEGVKVQPFDSAQGPPFKLAAGDAEAGIRSAGIVNSGMSLRVLGVDAQADGNPAFLPEGTEALQLVEGVEDEVIGDAEELDDVALFESGGKGVDLAAELLAPETRLPR